MKSPDALTVSDFIKRNFQTIARFCDLAKLDEKSVRNILKRVPGPALASLLNQAKLAAKQPAQAASYEIRAADLDVLRTHISAQYDGNRSAFARASAVDTQTLAQVLAGSRKRRTKQVVAIMKAAQVAGY